MLLAALDRLAERGPHDVRAETRGKGYLPPDPLLVDERLPDVEEDRANRHPSARCEEALGEGEIVRRRDLEEPRIARDDPDPPS